MLLTDEHASIMRRKALAFVRTFGTGAFFITWQLAPQSFKLIARSYKSSNSPTAILGMDPIQAKDQETVLCEINDFHPVYSVLAFERVNEIIKRTLFAWDSDRQCSLGRGWLGYTRALLHAVEEQSSGNLHAHAYVRSLVCSPSSSQQSTFSRTAV